MCILDLHSSMPQSYHTAVSTQQTPRRVALASSARTSRTRELGRVVCHTHTSHGLDADRRWMLTLCASTDRAVQDAMRVLIEARLARAD